MKEAVFVSFEEAFEGVPVGKAKLQSRLYKEHGKFPVIDQGQCEIAGYTDDISLLRREGLPLILFGDHTRKVQYLNFPFVVGADGVRLYRAREGFDAEYLFFFLKSAQLPNDGYGRHSKHLEDLKLAKLNIRQQRLTAARLKTQLAAVEEARQAAQLQLKETSFMKTQALSAIFSQIKNTSRIGNVAKVQSGFAFKSQEFTKEGTRLLRNTNILPGRVYWDDVVYLSPNSTDQYRDYVLEDGDVLISLDRPIISSGIKVTRVGPQDLPSLLVQRVGRFLIDETQLDAGYLYAFIRTPSFINAISGHDQSLGVPHISPTQVENVDIPLPDLNQQKRITELTAEVDRAADEAQASAQKQLTDIEMLPTRLLDQVFANH